MTTTPAPLFYSPTMEYAEEDEANTARELMETMRDICTTTFAHSGKPLRSVHAKSHGLIKGKLDIRAEDSTLAQGIFGATKIYDVVMRFSTTPGDMLPDNVSSPRGVALKILNVEGARLAGSEDRNSQDFVMVNGPAFGAPTGKAFLSKLKLLAATTDRSPTTKQVISAALRGVEHVLEAFGGGSGAVKALGGHPMTNPLGETYFTQAPILYGQFVAKLCLRPVSPALKDLKDMKVDLSGKPDGLREAVVDFFRSNEAEWELCAQLCTDIEKMPIEDSSVPWPEDESPYRRIGMLRVGPQAAWNEQLSTEIDTGMSFSPWNGVAAHRPLGSIMRLRKLSYEMSAQFRREHATPPPPPSP